MAYNLGKKEASSFPHIITRRDMEEATTDPVEIQTFIQRSSIQPSIKKQLAERVTIAHYQPSDVKTSSFGTTTALLRPVRFAQATMSTAGHTRGMSSVTNDDNTHSRSTSIGSMPGSKLKLAKKKKWTRFPLGDIGSGGPAFDAAAADNASDTTDFPDVSGSDFELSRPATPSINTKASVPSISTTVASFPKSQSQACVGITQKIFNNGKSAEVLSSVPTTSNIYGEQSTVSIVNPDTNVQSSLTIAQKKILPPEALELSSVNEVKSEPASRGTIVNADGMEQDLDLISMAGIAQAFAGNNAAVIKGKDCNLDTGDSRSASSSKDISRESSAADLLTSVADTCQHFGFGSNIMASSIPSVQVSAVTSRQTASDIEESREVVTGLAISSQIQKFEKLTARDDFDSIDWDPAFSLGISDSPEPVVAQPKKVEYTTVGSLVSSSSIPQITAPNRIQREGSGRRAALVIPQVGGYQMGSYYHPRFPASPYSQNLSQNPVNARFSLSQAPDSLYATYAHNSRNGQHQNCVHPTGQEMEAAYGQKAQIFPRIHASDLPPSSIDTYRVQDPQSSTDFPRAFPDRFPINLDGQDINQDAREPLWDRGSIPGMSKMQTLQSLSKFDNPMRNLAQSHLQRFSIASPADPGAAIETLLRNKAPNSPKLASKSSDSGELNRAYKFPSQPPNWGGGGPSSSQSNPLYGAFTPTPTRHTPPARGPQPLTAGPPGQRSYPPVPKFDAGSIDTLWSSNPLGYSQGDAFTSYTYRGSLYGSEYPAADLNLGPAAPRTQIVDTLDAVVAAKYYPNGKTSEFYQPLSFMEQTEMDRGRKLTRAEKATLNIEQIVYDNYEGQRRFHMTFDEYDEELRQRQLKPGWGYSQHVPIQPPSKVKDYKPITIEEMSNMPLVEAARPLFQAAYGSMLRYVNPSSASDKLKSGYETSAEHLLDRSEEGNKSFFGEDWGKPKTHRIGRDPRYGTRGFGRP